jgi:hypothetical protein
MTACVDAGPANRGTALSCGLAADCPPTLLMTYIPHSCLYLTSHVSAHIRSKEINSLTGFSSWYSPTPRPRPPPGGDGRKKRVERSYRATGSPGLSEYSFGAAGEDFFLRPSDHKPLVERRAQHAARACERERRSQSGGGAAAGQHILPKERGV